MKVRVLRNCRGENLTCTSRWHFRVHLTVSTASTSSLARACQSRVLTPQGCVCGSSALAVPAPHSHALLLPWRKLRTPSSNPGIGGREVLCKLHLHILAEHTEAPSRSRIAPAARSRQARRRGSIAQHLGLDDQPASCTAHHRRLHLYILSTTRRRPCPPLPRRKGIANMQRASACRRSLTLCFLDRKRDAHPDHTCRKP